MDSSGAYPQRPLSGKQLEHLLQALDRSLSLSLSHGSFKLAVQLSEVSFLYDK
jgi:hypothetical protein